jgi:hypothetical protein
VYFPDLYTAGEIPVIDLNSGEIIAIGKSYNIQNVFYGFI